MYIFVPQGDFSDKKWIRGKVNSATMTVQSIAQLTNEIIEISEDMTTLGYQYNYDPSHEYGLCAGYNQ